MITGDRNASHGDPMVQFRCAKELKAVVNKYLQETGTTLNSVQAEALDMDLTKTSRIVCGGQRRDHWMDKAGYSLIAAEATKDA